MRDLLATVRKSGSRPLVMVVDDDPEVVVFLQDILQEAGYRVTIARDGSSALRLLQKEAPGLVLLDIFMPGIDGYAVCQRIKTGQRTKDIPVVMVTAVGHELNRQLAIGSGVDGYITKPFTHQVLLDTIAGFLKSPKR